MSDMVNHPEHYSGKIECIDVIDQVTTELTGLEAFCTGNAIKYIWRWKHKGGLEDLRKAVWYLNKILGEQQ